LTLWVLSFLELWDLRFIIIRLTSIYFIRSTEFENEVNILMFIVSDSTSCISSAASDLRKPPRSTWSTWWGSPVHCYPVCCKNMGGQAMIAWSQVHSRTDGRLRLVGTWCWMPKAGGVISSCANRTVLRAGQSDIVSSDMADDVSGAACDRSGAIGFAQYFTYLIPLTGLEQKAISGILVIVSWFFFYRRITTIGRFVALLVDRLSVERSFGWYGEAQHTSIVGWL